MLSVRYDDGTTPNLHDLYAKWRQPEVLSARLRRFPGVIPRNESAKMALTCQMNHHLALSL
jgi:hypothetical protein